MLDTQIPCSFGLWAIKSEAKRQQTMWNQVAQIRWKSKNLNQKSATHSSSVASVGEN